jgi:hypothetical protein
VRQRILGVRVGRFSLQDRRRRVFSLPRSANRLDLQRMNATCRALARSAGSGYQRNCGERVKFDVQSRNFRAVTHVPDGGTRGQRAERPGNR